MKRFFQKLIQELSKNKKGKLKVNGSAIKRGGIRMSFEEFAAKFNHFSQSDYSTPPEFEKALLDAMKKGGNIFPNEHP